MKAAPDGNRSHPAGFTLVEVLAAMLLIAIVLPAVMQGITLATKAGSTARARTEAAGLGQSKLAELVATGQWQDGSLAGDFSPDWPAYRWEATTQAWSQDTAGAGLQEIDLRVIWMARGQEESVTLSTLVYARSQS
jgi:general secretion pathway protein I